VFVRVYRSLRSFRGESSFKTWLYSIVINVTRSHRSRRARQQPVWGDSGADDQMSFDTPDGKPDVETSLMRREAIQRAIAQLPAEMREAVTLRDVHGLDYSEIARATGVPIGTVESRIFRGRQRLRRALEPLRPHTASES
jgi:RNA polymerase sigma-70 factor (ECF subfamily)